MSPTGMLREFRDKLRCTLTRLIVKNVRPTLLCARYGVSHAPGSKQQPARESDIENNLFYNLGAKPFANSAVRGLRFGRADTFEKPFVGADCFYQYRLISQDSPLVWKSAPALLKIRAELGERFLPADWSKVWLSLGTGEILTGGKASPAPLETFALALRLLRPHGCRREVNLAGLLKPLFDGVVCALHNDEPPDATTSTKAANKALATRIRGKGGPQVSPEDIRRFLGGDRPDGKRVDLLGSTHLVRGYRNGCKCYPKDDRCVAGELIIEDTDVTRWTLEASVHRL